ncbi:MAG: hypothetical protein AABX48_04315 [Nanoarchaeota archaeon]
MPYIDKNQREKYDKIINELAKIVSEEKEELQDGDMNYIITKLIKKIYPLKYRHINRAMGMLECIKQEFYRRVAGPYEDIKIKENGDVE